MHLVTPDPALVMMTTIMTTMMTIIMNIMMVTVRRGAWFHQTQNLAVMAMDCFKLRHL